MWEKPAFFCVCEEPALAFVQALVCLLEHTFVTAEQC